MRTFGWCVAAVALAIFSASPAAAHADTGDVNPPIECPKTHAHVWHEDQCVDISDPFNLPGTGHGGSCGLICGVGKILGGLL